MTALPVLTAPPRLLVFDAQPRVLPFGALPSLLGPGDVLVFNDAATFPGSIHFERRGLTLELRLFEKIERGFKAVLFGPGDFHTRTEHREDPPRVELGEALHLAGLEARVSRIDTTGRLLELEFDVSDEVQWREVYRHGHPIQYAHQREPLPLWAVQNFYAERPWAAELPSAGYHFTFGLIEALRVRGAQIERLTHATGLSATGDDGLDRTLPWPERYSIPARTVAAVRGARRVIAVGTSVLRALEASGASGFAVRDGVATQAIAPHSRLRVVDGLITGIHSPQESHYQLLGALLDPTSLALARQMAEDARLRSHEFGDSALFFRAAA